MAAPNIAPDRIPVIVGVGQINDRPATPEAGLDSLGLMESALRLAEADAGGAWLSRIDSLAIVDQISFPDLGSVAAPLAARLGAMPTICEQTAMASGDSPILLLNEAANRIASGQIRIAAVVGGEALRTAAQRAAAAAKTAVADQNIIRAKSAHGTRAYHHRFGLTAPVDIYPLYENAARAAWGQSLAEGQAESGAIWSRFSEVAADNPAAWIRRPTTADAIVAVSADNRPIAFPYTKLMVANSSVNQGAGFIVTSLAEARARGIADDRLIYVGQGAAAHEANHPLKRDRYDRSPSMAVSLDRTLEANRLTIADIDHVELYSCFPCVPKMARRVIGWPVERPATLFGGLTFGGGPIGNYMSHAVASLVLRLRESGRHGLLFANGGFATHNHSIVLSRLPVRGDDGPVDFDRHDEANAARGPVPPIVEDYFGPATIETYTVLYQRDGSPRHGVVIARTPNGSRTLARVPGDDAATIDYLTDGGREPVGSGGVIVADADGVQTWRTA